MVQIRRVSILAQRTHGGLKGLMKFAIMSAAIPFVFWIRHYLHLDDKNDSSNGNSAPFHLRSSTEVFPKRSPTMDFLLRLQDQGYFTSSNDDDNDDWTRFGDVVQLQHCVLAKGSSSVVLMEYFGNFSMWADPILQNATFQAMAKESLTASQKRDLKQEFTLQLLELYAHSKQHQQHQQSRSSCDYKNYRPSPIPVKDGGTRRLIRHLNKLKRQNNNNNGEPRLFVTIIAHHDVDMLQRLIQAMQQPQHIFVIYLERRADPVFEKAVRALARAASQNIFVLQFGTILYGTDTVSQIQWKIQNWLLKDVKFTQFDYYVALDGASFPLWSSTDLLRVLTGKHNKNKEKQKRVEKNSTSETPQFWLGPMLHKGKPVKGDDSLLHLLRQKRLFFTMSPKLKLTFRLPRFLFADMVVDADIATAFGSSKSHSGNTAVYSQSVLQRMVVSPRVQELMALAKYAAFPVMEERTWAAAMDLIGMSSLTGSAVFQLYGDTESGQCVSSKRNVILTKNTNNQSSSSAVVCYKVEDAQLVHAYSNLLTYNETAGGYSFVVIFDTTATMADHGDSLLTWMKRAKEQQFLFARKFQTFPPQSSSVSLLDDITQYVW